MNSRAARTCVRQVSLLVSTTLVAERNKRRLGSREFVYIVSSSAVQACKGKELHILLTVSFPIDVSNPTTLHVDTAVSIRADTLSVLYIVFCSLSLFMHFVMFCLYRTYKVLRRFPSNLVFWRSICDALLELAFLWVNSVHVNSGDRDVACNVTVSVWVQFALMSSLLWFFAISFNFYFSMRFVRADGTEQQIHL